jgi:hypothetical protein
MDVAELAMFKFLRRKITEENRGRKFVISALNESDDNAQDNLKRSK